MTLKQKLASGQPLLGTFLKTTSPMICEVLARADLDLVCIDAEHAPFDRMAIDQCIYALRAGGMDNLVRIPALRSEYVLNALDCGADGVLAPHVLTSEDAKHLADYCQYGKGRGFAGSSRAAGYMAKRMAEHLADSAERSCAIAQIEDVAAIDNLDAILSAEGIDCFFIGRADLTVSMGLSDPNDPKVIELVEQICRAAIEKGKRVGMFTGNLDEIPHWRALGASLFLLGSDHSFLLSGAAEFSKQVRAHF
jgi:2-keto-3-deoxy-L-rhamnonate aldolase RhmA